MHDKAKKAIEAFGELLDLEIEVKKKSNGDKVDGDLFWAGLIGATLTLPFLFVIRWLIGK